MTQRQQNTHRMHTAVLDLLDRKDGLWKRTPAAADAVAAFRAPVERAAAANAERDGLGTTGLTANKAAARDAMEAAAMRLVLAARPFARVSGDGALLAAVDVKPSGFDRATEGGAVDLAQRVLGAVEPRLADLAGYNVSAKEVGALRSAIAAFTTAGPVRDATGGQREARTGSLSAAFREARTALRVLDDVVPGVIGDAELAAEYRRVRRTDDR